MAEKTLGARITLADRLSSGMMRVIQVLTRTQTAAEKMNQATQKIGQTMQSAGSQAASGMNRMSSSATAAANSASRMESAANSAAAAAERSGSAAERAAKKWQQLGQEYGTANKQSTMMMSNLDNASNALQTTGMAATAAGAGIAYGFGNAVNKAAEFEAQMSSIKSLGVTSADMKKLTNLAMEMGAETKFSSLEAAKGIEELQKAGVSVTQIINGGLAGALSLAVAGDLELADAAEIASTALNAFKKDQLAVTDAANILAGAANASATSVGELKYGLSAVSAVASGVGLNFKDTSTALAVFAQNGLKGSDAGTSLKTMLMNLTPKTKDQFEAFEQLGLMTFNAQKAMKFLAQNGMKPASSATKDVVDAMMQYAAKMEGAKVGSDKANKAFRELSMQQGIMSSAFYNQNGSIRSMAEIAGVLQKALAGMTDEQRQLYLYTMFGSDAIRAGNILYKEGAAGVQKMQQEMSKTTAAQVAAEKLNNLKGAVEQLNGSFETAQISIGNMFLPALTDLAKGAGWLMDKFNALPDPVKAVLVVFGVLTSAFLLISGPVLLFLGFLPAIASGLASVAGVLGVTSGALLSTVGVALLVVGAIAAVGVAFAFLYSKSATVRQVVHAAFAAVKNVVMQAVNAVKSFALSLWKDILAWWNRDGAMIRQAVQNIVKGITAAWNFLLPVIRPIFLFLKAMVLGAWENIKNIFRSGIGMIMNVISIFGALFTGNWSALWTNVKSLLMNALTFAWNLVQLTFLGRLLAPIRAGMTFVKAILLAGWNFVKGIFTRTFSSVVGLVRFNMAAINMAIRGAMNVIRTVISIGWNIIKGIFSVALNLLRGNFSGAWNAMKNTAKIVWTSIRGLVKQGIDAVWQNVKAGMERVKTFFTGKWEDMTKTVSTLPAKFKTYGKNLIDGLWNGIKNAAVGLGDKIQKLIDENIPGPVKDLLGIASPSKLFHQFGSWTMQGLEQGISSGASGVMNSVKRVANDLASTPFGSSIAVATTTSPISSKPNNKPGRIFKATNGSRSSGNAPIQVVNHISISGDQVATMAQDKEYMRKTAREVVEEFMEEVERAIDNYSIDNLGTMMD